MKKKRLRCGGIQHRPVTATLLAINVVMFALQWTLLPHLLPLRYLMLSLDGLQHGYVWQLLTYQFLHGDPWGIHLLLNCWALFLFGRKVERTLGRRRYLTLYLCSGVMGGLFQVLVSLLWPQYFGRHPVVGASAGVFGVMAAFALMFPKRQLLMLVFFVIPMVVRTRSLLWFSLVLTVLGIAFPQSWLAKVLGGNIAHAAHLGGILTGLALIPPKPSAAKRSR